MLIFSTLSEDFSQTTPMPVISNDRDMDTVSHLFQYTFYALVSYQISVCLFILSKVSLWRLIEIYLSLPPQLL